VLEAMRAGATAALPSTAAVWRLTQTIRQLAHPLAPRR
jgi:hypothetical protein